MPSSLEGLRTTELNRVEEPVSNPDSSITLVRIIDVTCTDLSKVVGRISKLVYIKYLVHKKDILTKMLRFHGSGSRISRKCLAA